LKIEGGRGALREAGLLDGVHLQEPISQIQLPRGKKVAMFFQKEGAMKSEKDANSLRLISRMVREGKVIVFPIYDALARRWERELREASRPQPPPYGPPGTQPVSSLTSESPPNNIIFLSKRRTIPIKT